jgi:putative pyruvate formate lyase activating enzyme
MPDFKFWDPDLSKFYMTESSYPEVARTAIKEMHRQVGDLKFDGDGLALRGLLVRHLVMPNRVAGADKIFRFLVEEVSPHTYVNIMDQYYPDAQVVRKPGRFKEIERRVTGEEFREARQYALEAGLYRFDGRWRQMKNMF